MDSAKYEELLGWDDKMLCEELWWPLLKRGRHGGRSWVT